MPKRSRRDEIPEEVSAEQLLMSAEQPRSDQTEAERLALLEAIVYVTDEPLSLQQIAKALGQAGDRGKTAPGQAG